MKNVLKHIRRSQFNFAKVKTASVIVCIDQNENVLLTVRSKHLKHHPGEVCLPGGMQENNENFEETALREANEEIGLPNSAVDIITRLDPFLSKSGVFVIPVVCSLKEEFDVNLNKDEVDSLFRVPLKVFVCKEWHRSDDIQWQDLRFTLHYFDYEGQCIWGMTALVMIHFSSIYYSIEHSKLPFVFMHFDYWKVLQEHFNKIQSR